MSEAKTTRRGVVAGGLALLGGLGIGAAATSRATDPAPAAGRRLELHAPQLRLGDPDAVPGLPGRATRLEGRAHLLDRAGKPAGRFTSVVLPGSDAGVELHTFELEGGTLLGMGRAGAFAVVGGTGSFARAQGAYALDHRAQHLGGDGSADFVIDLSA